MANLIVAFRQFDIVFVAIAGAILKTFVVVVDGNGKNFFGPLLANNVFVEDTLDFPEVR